MRHEGLIRLYAKAVKNEQIGLERVPDLFKEDVLNEIMHLETTEDLERGEQHD